MKNKCQIIIRTKSNIKSRQWWNCQFLKIRKILLKYLIKKEINDLIANSSLALLITNNKEIQKLNKKFRNKNKATDVLSFHLNKKEQIKNNYLGDIVISLEQASKQAKQENKKLEDELKMLLIHGYLHLVGYDHRQKRDAKIMFPLQDSILRELN